MNGEIRPFRHQIDDGQPKHFITYFGDIYHGIVVKHPEHKDRFFILSINQLQEFSALKPEEKTLENYSRLCWEIRDDNVIVQTVPNQYQFGTNINIDSPPRYGNHVWKRMFVFGAGASAYCNYGEELIKLRKSIMRPPIGNEIFDENYDQIIDKYPGLKGSIQEFISKGKDIEGCMEEEWNDIKYYHNRQIACKHINIQFFLQELLQKISRETVQKFWRTNLYGLLATKLQKFISRKSNNETLAFVSFNQDTISDSFLSDAFQLDLNNMEDYTNYNKQRALLFKPHGSSNWGWPFQNKHSINTSDNLASALYEKKIEPSSIYYNLLGNVHEMTGSWGIEKAANEHGRGRYTLNKNKIEVITNGSNKDYFPALLLPYRDKDEFVMPYDHYHSMQWFMGDMEELYLIGWKGNEAMFNRMIRDHALRLKKIVIVNPNEEKNKEVSLNLAKIIDIKKYEIEVVNSFEEFVLKKMDEIFASPF